MHHSFARKTYWVVFTLLLAWASFSCGVKGPPMPLLPDADPLPDPSPAAPASQ